MNFAGVAFFTKVTRQNAFFDEPDWLSSARDAMRVKKDLADHGVEALRRPVSA